MSTTFLSATILAPFLSIRLIAFSTQEHPTCLKILVLKAVHNVNTVLNEALHGFDVFDQKGIDRLLCYCVCLMGPMLKSMGNY